MTKERKSAIRKWSLIRD